MTDKKVIGICGGPTCCNHNKLLWEYAEALECDDVVFEEAQCLGMCETAPNIRVDEKGERKKYQKVSVESLKNIE